MFESIAWDRSRQAELQKRDNAPLSQVPVFGKSRPALFEKKLASGERLFSSGEPKECLYRVERGVIRVSWKTAVGLSETIETVETGGVFGLGYLDYHLYDATAVSDAVVSFWPRSALGQLTQQSPILQDRQADAVEREFMHLRRSIVTSPADRPIGRLAAFLSVVSRMNAAEGRDPTIVDETMQGEVVAEYLRMDVGTLSQALVELERRGLVELEPPRGLRINDPEGLDRLTL